MASSEATPVEEEVTECGLCRNAVSSFCRQCKVNLCDSCIPNHLRAKSKTGHVIINFTTKYDDDDSCYCESHPQYECSSYCKTCEVPICLHCTAHKSHQISELSDKIEELIKVIARESDKLQSFRHQLETVLDHTTKQLSSLPSFYQKRKDEVTAKGQEWYRQIEKTVKNLHQELDDLKKENKAVLLKQKGEIEKMIGTAVEMIRKATNIQTSKNVKQMEKFKQEIAQQETLKEFTQYTFPTFHECKIDGHYLQTYFGYIEKMKQRKMSLSENKFIPDTDSGRKVLEVPSVSSVIDTGFPANKNSNRLYGMTVTDDQKVWMGGNSYELKLFDLQGHLHRAVTTTDQGMFICMYNKQVVYSDMNNKGVKKISDDDTVVTMFKTGDWTPVGITGSASGDLLVCLNKGDQSKVVRYSSTGTVLQEIQYDSQCQPLYQYAWYIAENVNGDIIVTDFKKKMAIAVDGLGIFRYTYSGKSNDDDHSVATDSVGHVYVTEYKGNNIHMLDRDGRFLRYIIPEGGIKYPRSVCMIGDGEMIVGEEKTGLAKRIKFLEEQYRFVQWLPV
ncbi:uncharacterized protein LOC111125741 [Crassostrea virginica]